MVQQLKSYHYIWIVLRGISAVLGLGRNGNVDLEDLSFRCKQNSLYTVIKSIPDTDR